MTEVRGASMGEQLRELRRRKVLTQEQLAVDSGVSSATIRRIESGQLTPRFSTIRKLAKGLGLQPEELAGTARVVESA